MPTSMYFLSKAVADSTNPADLTFSTIPTTGYASLFLWISGKSVVGGDYDTARIQINGVTTGNYFNIYQYAGNYGSPTYNTTSALNQTSAVIGSLPAAGSYAQTFSTIQVFIPVYNSAPAGGTYKKAWSFMQGMCSPQAVFYSYQGMGALQNLSGSVTSIKVFPAGGGWKEGSSAYLYGLKST